MSPAIAVIGMACCYPDARSPQQLWENVLAGRRSFRRIPPERLSLEDYFSLDPNAADAIYANEAAVIEGYEFDRVKFSIAGSTFRAADLVHWLALDMAGQALTDAGFPVGEGLPAETTGVLVGNTLTGEFSRANTLRLRWPYVRRTVDAQLRAKGWDKAQRSAFLGELEAAYKAPFPVVGEETLAGGLSNTIAGRICNQFRLNGGGYTVDGACSSSLLAAAQACSALAAGDLDAALVGGVDLSLDPFELVGFAKTGALAHGAMRVYDRDADGFLPGEGCGFVLLMRHDDALARGLNCYGVIRGWGISSDGGGGITRPEVNGQRLALERAYRRAGFSIGSVALFEGHGTGTAVGDDVELRTLSAARRANAVGSQPAVIGSVKATIGHTKAAAGIAGLIKATMAVHTQILPPAVGVENPHAELTGDAPALRVLQQGIAWPEDQALRAGVSSFGFGGINVHLALEGVATVRRNGLTDYDSTLLSSAQDAELFLLGAVDTVGLMAQVDRLLGLAARLSYAELADLAACLAGLSHGHGARAAVVAASPRELGERLGTLREWLTQGTIRRLDSGLGIFVGAGAAMPRIAFLFPGQASPVRLTGGSLARRFSAVAKLYAGAALPTHGDTRSTAVAQPAIVAAELAGMRVLQGLGIEAAVAVGHSLGELTALHWAGVFGEDTLMRIASVRGRVMSEVPGPRGAMASVAAGPAEIEELLGGQGEVVIAGFNSPRQTVISGDADAVAGMVTQARARGKVVTPLPVADAFHSPRMLPAADALAAHLAGENFGRAQRRLVSTVSGGEIGVDEDVRALLKHQLTLPVRFTEALHEALEGIDLCLEVGPGRVLTGLVRECSDVPVVAIDAAGASLCGLLYGVGAAYALGAPIDAPALFADRFTRPFVLDWQPRFFANPCELAPRLDDGALAEPQAVDAARSAMATPTPAAPSAPGALDSLDLVRKLVAQRAELPVQAIKDDSRLLMDLHLNSITVGQLAGEAARQMGLPPPASPTDYADATVAQMAQALRDLAESGVTAAAPSERVPAGVDAWVRAFVVDLVEQPLPTPRSLFDGDGDWRILAATGHPLAESLSAALKKRGGRGVVVCLSPSATAADVGLLLQAARLVLEQKSSPRHFVLVQHWGGGASSFAKTLFLEARDLTVCVVEVPAIPAAVDWVLYEIQAAAGFSEAHYNSQGTRREPRLRPLPVEESVGAIPLPLGCEDVLLVSGGGKGIAAECALALALETGVRLALLGRSRPEDDPVLAANLERLGAKGVIFRYFAADVAAVADVQAAVAKAQTELGQISAVLHGAGINHPVLLRNLDQVTFERTLATKVNGARNLLAAVDADRLRLFVSFSSIIGRTGMRGEADYAVANQWLSHLTEEFQASHPACRCLAIEWSVWSGVGMGERLGRIDALIQEGITPIAPDAGIAVLRRLLSQPLPAVAVVVTGRFGDAPTLKLARTALPFLRFLEQPRVYYPGVELVADSELSVVSDPYLDDHVFHGERLFPAVMGLEAMAQVAMAALGERSVPVFEDVAFLRPVVVGEQTVVLRVAALVRAQGKVELVLRSSATAFLIDHFRAVCRFGQQEAEAGTAQLPAAAAGHAEIDIEGDLYGSLLFHGGRFRRLRGYRQLSAKYCCADIGADDVPAWFARYLPADLVLGDPASRDAAIHAIQACIPHGVLLPTGIERWIPGALQVPGPWVVRASERRREGDDFCYDLELSCEDGRLRERWQGLRLRKMAAAPRQGKWAIGLLGAFVERRLQELLPGVSLAVAVERDARAERQVRSDQAVHHALGQNVRIYRRPDGKPDAMGDRIISAAHAGELTLAVGGESSLACDMEAVRERPDQAWRDLLGPERHGLAERIAQEANEPFTTAATRVWTALECLKKAGLTINTPLTLFAVHRDGWVLLSAGRASIAACAALLKGNVEPLVLTVLTVDKKCDSENSGVRIYRYMN